MSRGCGIDGANGRGFGLLLASFALMMLVLAPPGFMLAPTAHGAEVVVCTGHGPLLTVSADLGHPGKAPKSRPDGPCLFAGHGPATTPDPGLVLAPQGARLHVGEAKVLVDLIPGRGLVAPPPPSHAPPLTL